ncbi:MAG: chemotaxis protein CheA [Roseobacter sp.]|nr:chemotaxis protein CheA [Roseobacter sp.]
MSELSEMFFQECDELLEGLVKSLGEIESGSADDETVNSMFRAVHSIKGGAGAFGLTAVVSFAHVFENVLDDVRSKKLAIDDNVVALFFMASDQLTDLIDACKSDGEAAAEANEKLVEELSDLHSSVNRDVAPELEEEISFQPMALDLGLDLAEPNAGPAEGQKEFEITFAPRLALYEAGHEPALLIRTLQDMGELSVTADLSSVGTASLDANAEAWIVWHLHLKPDAGVDESTIREVFEFVEGLCRLDIETSDTAAFSGALPDMEALSGLPDLPPAVLPGLEAAPEAAAETPQPPQSELQSSAQIKKKAAPVNNTIRVDLERVDRLINLVGELVISEAMLRQSMSGTDHERRNSVDDAMSQLRQLSGMLQEGVMAIRAQPVRGLFQRMSRIVRETAKEAGKSAQLVTIGDSTEVDKTVTERLVEPLTHMIRNAVDHGLEAPEARLAAGKPEKGFVTLEAMHRSGRVIITLSDDGAGINRPKVRAIAESKDLVRPGEDLSDADIDNLLFRPGFSTATEVSNLSGRGVGMDVVRNEIQSLGGRVSISSTPGVGTKMTISLPLTLAVLEGMVVIVEGEALVVPTLALRETLQPGQAQIHEFCENDRALSINGQLIPVSDLGSALGYRKHLTDLSKQVLLMIEGDAGQRAAIAVDKIVDQREVVIKGLEQNYMSIPGISAATILGDGNIALIVDTDQMFSTQAPEASELSVSSGPRRHYDNAGTEHHV